MSLLDKMKKTGFKEVVSASKMVEEAVADIFGDMVPTSVPAFNIAISGRHDGGVGSGVVNVAGPSKHFKTMFCLLAASAYLKANEDALMLYYDSEGGASIDYLRLMEIDTDRVLHLPIKNIEELKFDLVQKLEALEKNEKVFIMIDSVGNLASKKELEDAINENSAADMSRAKALKSLFRIVTPYVKNKNIPLYAVQHTYKTMETYAKDIISGGSGAIYSADTNLIIGKRQVKDGKELKGNEFVLNVDKSRFIKEKSVIPITVMFDGGVDKNSSVFEWACLLGYVISPKMGWYTRHFVEGDKNWRKKEIEEKADEFFKPIFEETPFWKEVEEMYMLSSNKKELDLEALDELTEVIGE